MPGATLDADAVVSYVILVLLKHWHAIQKSHTEAALPALLL